MISSRVLSQLEFSTSSISVKIAVEKTAQHSNNIQNNIKALILMDFYVLVMNVCVDFYFEVYFRAH